MVGTQIGLRKPTPATTNLRLYLLARPFFLGGAGFSLFVRPNPVLPSKSIAIWWRNELIVKFLCLPYYKYCWIWSCVEEHFSHQLLFGGVWTWEKAIARGCWTLPSISGPLQTPIRKKLKWVCLEMGPNGFPSPVLKSKEGTLPPIHMEPDRGRAGWEQFRLKGPFSVRQVPCVRGTLLGLKNPKQNIEPESGPSRRHVARGLPHAEGLERYCAASALGMWGLLVSLFFFN